MRTIRSLPAALAALALLAGSAAAQKSMMPSLSASHSISRLARSRMGGQHLN